MTCASTIAILLATSAVQPLPQEPAADSGEPAAYRIVLPEGPAARAWAGVGPTTRPATLEPEAHPADAADPRFGDPDTWVAWAEALSAERSETDAAGADPERRAELALFAWAGRRSQDSWNHVAKTTADPAWTATATARLLPGLPLERLGSGGLGPGGRPLGLPEGIVLRPALPPASGSPITGRLERRRASVEGLVVGETTMNMIVRVEAEGVQIDFVHVAGPAARLFVVPPVPDGFRTRVEYIDWFRQETVGEPLEVVVDPEQQEPNTVYARMRATESRWPTRLPATLPAALGIDGLHLVTGPQRNGRVDGLAAALRRLFEFEVTVHAQRDPVQSGLWIDLASDDSAMKFKSLVALVERSVLEH